MANPNTQQAVLCVAVAVGTSAWLGQDASWDLRNYHYYNPYAWLHSRADIDIAPAQLQSFHSPFADLPMYAMVQVGLPSWLIGSVLALPAALALFFLVRIAELLLPDAQRRLGSLAVVLVAATGACGRPVIGSSMSEWHVTALFTAAIWLVLKAAIEPTTGDARPARRIWLVAGLLGGVAVGLKLTGGPFAVGLAAMVVSLAAAWSERFRRIVFLAAGGAAGFALAYGPWAWELWVRYQNPFFPYFNDLFQSPWAAPGPYTDARYSPSAVELVTLPWRWFADWTAISADPKMRDWRIGIALPAMLWLAWRQPASELRVAWRGLLSFALTSYVLWALIFENYRFIGSLELIASLSLIALMATIGGRVAAIGMLVTILVIVGTTKWPNWGRLPHGKPAVTATVSAMPKDAMVVIASGEPMAYVMPSLPAGIPVISFINNFMNPQLTASRLQRVALNRLSQHNGSIWLLANHKKEDEVLYDRQPVRIQLEIAGLAPSGEPCRPIQSGLDGNDLMLCPLHRATSR